MTDKPSIRAILEHYQCEVPMRGRREVQILCPVHEENRPSCSVNETENLIHCQACGFGGDAYSLVMRKEGVDFAESVRIVERITGTSDPRQGRRSGHTPGRRGGFRPKYRRGIFND